MISVVTVIHNSAEHLTRLLASLGAHAPGAQVIVVDSGSSDDGAQIAEERGAEVVDLPDNPGYGAGNNAGVQRARHDVTALLNPDVELLDGGMLELARRVDGDALLYPRLLNPDGSVQDSAHPRPGTASEVARALLPSRLAPQPYRAKTKTTIGWAIAAALVARTETLKRLGPFDPDAFLFYEDLALSLRAERCELHPDIALRHVGGHSTGSDRLSVEATRRREVVGERLGAKALRNDDVAQALTFVRAGVRSRRAREQLRALRVARRA